MFLQNVYILVVIYLQVLLSEFVCLSTIPLSFVPYLEDLLQGLYQLSFSFYIQCEQI